MDDEIKKDVLRHLGMLMSNIGISLMSCRIATGLEFVTEAERDLAKALESIREIRVELENEEPNSKPLED